MFLRWRDLFGSTGRAPIGDYVPSFSLRWCEWFSVSLAHDRRSRFLDVPDFLGAVYIVSLEYQRICGYWKEWGRFEELVSKEFGVKDIRLNYWFSLDEELARHSRWRPPPSRFKVMSPELQKIYGQAVSLTRVREGEEGVGKAMVFPEHLLLAIAGDAGSSAAKTLLESTLDVPRLDEAAGKLNKYSR